MQANMCRLGMTLPILQHDWLTGPAPTADLYDAVLVDAVWLDAAEVAVSCATVVSGAAVACAVEPAVAADAPPDSGRPPAKADPPADMAVPAIKEIQSLRITYDPLTITSLL